MIWVGLMTQPDQYFPDTAVNALSFADYSATTQTEWEDQIHAGLVSHFNIAEIAFEALLGWVEQIPIIGPIASDALAAAQSALAQLTNLIQDLLNAPASVLGNLFDAVVDGVNSIGDFIGGLFTGFGGTPGGGSGVGGAALVADVTARAAVVTSTATTALETGENTIKGMFNEWYGTDTAEGTVEEVEQVFGSVRASVGGGFTLQTFTASDASWTVPDEVKTAAELYVGVFGGGGRGEAGQVVNSNTGGIEVFGGAGGSSGGYRLEKIDPSTLDDTLDIQVGAAASTAGADGGVTSITSGSTVLAESAADIGSIATPQGYLQSASTPGRGGKGGDAITAGAVTAGEAGESNAAAAGGAGGAGATATGAASAVADPGVAGGDGSTTVLPMCGGAGGGGGGGARVSAVIGTGNAFGGDGGNGGAPGGGSGGGGAAADTAGGGAGAGNPGTPGQGLAFMFYR